MKKYFAIAAAVLAFVSCSKSASVKVVSETEEDNTPVPVLFGNTNTLDVAVKGQGAVDAFDGTQKLHVFAHDKDSTLNADGSYLIDNVVANSPVDPNNDSSIYVLKANGEYYYYDGAKNYDFFAYFADDATAKAVVKAADKVSVELTIDGSQDILYANADPAVDQTQDVTGKAALPISRLYSATSARRGIKPNLPFKHAGTRFVFEIEDATNGKNINIDSIKIKADTLGVLTFKGEGLGLAATNALPDSLKMDIPAGTTVASAHAARVAGGAAYKGLGKGLIAIPNAADYSGVISLSQVVPVYYKDGDDIPDGKKIGDPTGATSTTTVENDLPINFAGRTPAKAEAGKQYRVKIKIYGIEQVEITVSLEAWDEDENPFNVDEDDEA